MCFSGGSTNRKMLIFDESLVLTENKSVLYMGTFNLFLTSGLYFLILLLSPGNFNTISIYY